MPPDDKALVQHAIARQPQVSACGQQALRQVCIQTENDNDIYKCDRECQRYLQDDRPQCQLLDKSLPTF